MASRIMLESDRMHARSAPRLAITGTPGSGKTSIAKSVAGKLGLRYVAEKEFMSSTGVHVCEDDEFDAAVVDERALSRHLKRRLRELARDGFVVEGHVICGFELDVDHVIVLRCEPDELKRRLRIRKYPKAKIDENVMAEMLDYCALEAERAYGNSLVIEIDASKTTATRVADKIAEMTRGKTPWKGDAVDWSEQLISAATRKKTHVKSNKSIAKE